MDVKHGIMDEVEEEEESLGPFSSLSESSRGSSSSSFELTEDTASSGSSSSSSSPTSSCKGPLFAMSSLKEQLPFKRGLSKYYEGKSQSFTSLSNVSCLEDLVKPERPPKRLKSSTSCGGGLDDKKSLPLIKCCNKRALAKKASKGCFSSPNVSARRNCLLLGSKPPLYPHRNGNLSDRTLWFA